MTSPSKITKNNPKSNINTNINTYLINNINSNLNKKEIKEKEIKEKENNENKTTEITRIKAPRQNRVSDFEMSNDEESSAQLEDVSEVNTIYTMKNIVQVNTTRRSRSNEKNQNIDSDNVIEEVDDYSKNIIKGSVYNLTKDKILLPYIYKLTLYNNNSLNKTLNVLKNCNGKLFKMINSEDYVRLLERNQKNVAAYQIYCLFSFFNNGKNFYKLKYAFSKWKKLIEIFNQISKIKHIKNLRGHCLGCDCQDLQQCHISYCCCENEEENSKCCY